MKNRQRDEIERDILTICNGGAVITKVMFQAYMTHGQTKAYLEQLISKGFADHDPLTRLYSTTPKGMEYLSVRERMAELFPITTKRAAAKAGLLSTFP